MKNEPNKTKEEYVNLIARLNARFHTAKICKTFAGLAIAGTMLVSTVACSNEGIYNPNNTDTNTQSTGQHETTNRETTGAETNRETETDVLEQYSELLQNVLTNSTYNSLIAQAESGNFDLYERGEFKPHPYAFLEEQGIDVDAIKNGELDCYTYSYVLDEEPNNLYMYTRITDDSVVTNYLLKYELTDQEMDDYDLTHDDPATIKGYFVQAVFMNNEISKMKTPEIVGTSQMTLEAFEGLTENMSERYPSDFELCNVIMINPNPTERTFKLILLPRYYVNEQMARNDVEAIYIDCQSATSMNNGIYDRPYSYGTFAMNETIVKNATLYLTQAAPLNLIYCKVLDENLN